MKPQKITKNGEGRSFSYFLRGRECEKKGPGSIGRKRTINPRILGLGKTKLITNQSLG